MTDSSRNANLQTYLLASLELIFISSSGIINSVFQKRSRKKSDTGSIQTLLLAENLITN
jgi:hypothetical protein